jgi:hypothetical protein
MRERRRERRQKVLRQGKVMLTEWVAVDCLVRDLSRGGARLEFAGPVSLPSAFQLRLVSADLTIPAAPAWQRRGEAGIRFTGAAVAAKKGGGEGAGAATAA